MTFPDGSTQQYAANVITENMLSQVDDKGHHFQLVDNEGHHYQLLDYYIIDHRKSGKAVERGADGYVTRTKSGKRKKRRHATQGCWEFPIMWRDGKEPLVKLNELKESFPVEVAEYAERNGIIEEPPAFDWWAKYTLLKRRDCIIAAVKAKKKKKTHKYGDRVPSKTVREAYEIDKVNGNDLWRKATIAKEMKNNRIASFEIYSMKEQQER